MKNIASKVKEAYAREAFVQNAKATKVDKLTHEQMKEIIKWDREAKRNTIIALAGIGIITAIKVKKI